MPFRIFFSHNTRDRSWCEWLKSAAEELGIEVYIAEHDIQPGTPLASRVQGAIESSDAVVVLITDNSVAAPYVQQEIGWALHARKVIVPLVQPGIPAERLAMLQGVEYIPFDFEHPEAGRDRLVTALHGLVEQQQQQKQDQETLLLALACFALIFLALSTGSQ
jgi:hypothetical protein